MCDKRLAYVHNFRARLAVSQCETLWLTIKAIPELVKEYMQCRSAIQFDCRLCPTLICVLEKK